MISVPAVSLTLATLVYKFCPLHLVRFFLPLLFLLYVGVDYLTDFNFLTSYFAPFFLRYYKYFFVTLYFIEAYWFIDHLDIYMITYVFIPHIFGTLVILDLCQDFWGTKTIVLPFLIKNVLPLLLVQIRRPEVRNFIVEHFKDSDEPTVKAIVGFLAPPKQREVRRRAKNVSFDEQVAGELEESLRNNVHLKEAISSMTEGLFSGLVGQQEINLVSNDREEGSAGNEEDLDQELAALDREESEIREE